MSRWDFGPDQQSWYGDTLVEAVDRSRRAFAPPSLLATGGGALFHRDTVETVIAAPGVGKTWLGQLAAAHALLRNPDDAGGVVWLDTDAMGAAELRARFNLLGVRDDALRGLRYVAPDTPLRLRPAKPTDHDARERVEAAISRVHQETDDLTEARARCSELGYFGALAAAKGYPAESELSMSAEDAALVVIDSLTAAMTLQGLSPTDTDAVEDFYRTVVRPLGVTTIVLDHLNRDGSYYGAERKLSGVDAGYVLHPRGPSLVRGGRCRIDIEVVKNRPGYHRCGPDGGPLGHLGYLDLASDVNGRVTFGLTIDPTSAPPAHAHGHARPSVRTRPEDLHTAILDHVRASGGGTARMTIEKAVAGRNPEIRAALDDLTARGLLVEHKEPGKTGARRYYLPSSHSIVPPSSEHRPASSDDPSAASSDPSSAPSPSPEGAKGAKDEADEPTGTKPHLRAVGGTP